MVHFRQICLVGKRARGDTGFLGHVRQTGIMSSDILTTTLVTVGNWCLSELAEDLSQVETLGPSQSLRNEKHLPPLTCARERMGFFWCQTVWSQAQLLLGTRQSSEEVPAEWFLEKEKSGMSASPLQCEWTSPFLDPGKSQYRDISSAVRAPAISPMTVTPLCPCQQCPWVTWVLALTLAVIWKQISAGLARLSSCWSLAWNASLLGH